MSSIPVKRALLSVSDKTGIIEFAQGLRALGVELLSTGGTYAALTAAHIPVRSVEEVTASPEMLGGRVKTLHPRIHGGILARRQEDSAAIVQYDLPLIDLVVVNLYPFAATIQKSGTTFAEAIENIDIGGPTMIRGAAKNHADVGVVVNPSQYASVLDALQNGGLSAATRAQLALEAFEHTAHYDAMVAAYLGQQLAPERFPATLTWPGTRSAILRYGENPHQQAAFYTDSMIPEAQQWMVPLQGKALSFNNVADTDAAVSTLMGLPNLSLPACVIVKHENPCGAATGSTLMDAYNRAWAGDSVSAFGGIIALNQSVDATLMAHILGKQFVEVLAAPHFSEEAKALAQGKPLMRLLEIPAHFNTLRQHSFDMKRVAGGILVQQWDDPHQALILNCVTSVPFDPARKADAHFAWSICQQVKSNAIVFVRDGQTLGIGAGQMSRIVSVDIAIQKAKDAGFSLEGALMASDAFLPFTDTLIRAAEAGIRIVVQPGGSKKDPEVIAAAEAQGVAMIFTGTRHFKH